MTLDSRDSREVLAAPTALSANPHPGAAAARDLPVYERWAQELSTAAARLIEAAFQARGGAADAARTHIAHTIALLQGMPNSTPRNTTGSRGADYRIERGALPAWQTRKVIAHVEGNLSRRIRVRELADLLGLSTGHFSRAFKCAAGSSPRDYIQRRRIEVAQAMMLTTRESLHSIAANCGMCDQQHFTRSFRRIVGEAPSMWRRTRLGLMDME